METEIANVDRQIERAVAAIIQGRITEAEAAAHLPGLRAQRARLAAELAALGSRPVILTLRPAIVEGYGPNRDRTCSPLPAGRGLLA